MSQRFLPYFRPNKAGIELLRLWRQLTPGCRPDALGYRYGRCRRRSDWHSSRHTGRLCRSGRFCHRSIPIRFFYGFCRSRRLGRCRLTPRRHGNGPFPFAIVSASAQDIGQGRHQDKGYDEPQHIHGLHLLSIRAPVVVMTVLTGRDRLSLRDASLGYGIPHLRIGHDILHIIIVHDT